MIHYRTNVVGHPTSAILCGLESVPSGDRLTRTRKKVDCPRCNAEHARLDREFALTKAGTKVRLDREILMVSTAWGFEEYPIEAAKNGGVRLEKGLPGTVKGRATYAAHLVYVDLRRPDERIPRVVAVRFESLEKVEG